MSAAPRILVVGAGGTGGYFGGRLVQAGRDVSFLVRPARAVQLRERGLQVVSPHGDLTLHPPLLTTAELGAPFDLVLLGVKAYALAQAIDDLAPAVGPDTLILPMLNGLRHIELLAARFGARAVLGGVSQIVATVDDDGRVVQMTPMHKLAYGARAGAPVEPARLDGLHALLGDAGFDARLSRAIDQDMWEKWVFLATLAGITCLMRGTIGEIEAVPGGASLTLQLLHECAAVARAHGHAPADAFLDQAGATLTSPGSALAASMYRDLQRGHRVEADQVLGDLLVRAHQAEVATPVLAVAFANLRVYEGKLRGS